MIIFNVQQKKVIRYIHKYVMNNEHNIAFYGYLQLLQVYTYHGTNKFMQTTNIYSSPIKITINNPILIILQYSQHSF